MDCARNNQRPGTTQKVWVCINCGTDTKPFGTEAAGESEPKDLRASQPTLGLMRTKSRILID